MRRGVLPIVGHRIEAAEIPPCERRPITFAPAIATFDRRLKHRTIVGIGRRGKRVMIEIDDGQTIVIEPRMTGLVLLADPPTTDHLRLRLTLSGGDHRQLLFWDRRGLGTVRLLHQNQIAAMVDAKLGIDALAITAEQLRGKLCHSRRAVKVALLDQSAVAGIGNLYAAEILFLAGVDPRTRCDKLTRPQWQRITAAIGEVLHAAIAHEGSTLSDGTYRNALNDAGGYQNYHRVYDRAGTTCRRCESAEIRRIVQAQRSTFFCPACQRKSGMHDSVIHYTNTPNVLERT